MRIQKMDIVKDMNQRVKKFSIFDLKLVQGTGIFLTLILVKLIPQIMKPSVWWYVGLFILCVIRPFYVFFIKE